MRNVNVPMGTYRWLFAWIPPVGISYMDRAIGRLTGRSQAPATIVPPPGANQSVVQRKATVAYPGYSHEYVRHLRGSVRGGVRVLPYPTKLQFSPKPNFRFVDIFHLHFVEIMGHDYGQTKELISELKTNGTKIVWTAHDLTPHFKHQEFFDPIFQLWAYAADGMIHHSHYGERRIRERYDFPDSTLHTVIGNRYRREHGDLNLEKKRAEFESQLGIAPAKIRIGLIGVPRAEKKVREFLDGVTLSTARDIQVVCWSLRPGETAPHDERIAIAEPYSWVYEHTHEKRLAVCDLIALPIDPDGEMLTSGFVVDAVAMGLGILASEWEYLTESAGEAAIPCGHSAESVAECLNALTVTDVVKARAASLELRSHLDWESAREPTLNFYQAVLDASS
jgi:hypothetical protein